MAERTGVTVAYADAVEQGVALCRTGNWDEGLMCLNHILQTSKAGTVFPGMFYSFLGYGIARKENRIAEGIKLCQRAVTLEFYEPNHYLNLARTYLLAGNRRQVARVLEEGLALDPFHKGLLRLREIFGIRREPVLRFLPRANFLNRYLGRMRHRYVQAKMRKGAGLSA